MKLNKQTLFILAVGLVATLIGIPDYDLKVSDLLPSETQQFASEANGETEDAKAFFSLKAEAESRGKTIICKYSVLALEEKQDSAFFQVGNFPPLTLKNRDTYLIPGRQTVPFVGKRVPNEQDLIPLVSTWKKKAKIVAVWDIKAIPKSCEFIDPDTPQEEPKKED